MHMDDMSERMIFIIGSPRSGSTLLERMVSSHSAVLGGPEPHLLTPLAHLGYFETVDRAPYDHLRAVDAQRDFIASLPGGEADYLDALRAYCSILYGRKIGSTGKRYYLDKTPAYALVLPFIRTVFPRAKYIVLTRHPAAIFNSYADSFFEGDWRAAHEYNPIVERYVPAIARFLQDPVEFLVHVRYEDLVRNAEEHMRRICDMLDLEYESGMVEYGSKQRVEKGLGDPFGVSQHSRPVTSSIHKWVVNVLQDPEKESMLRTMIDDCDTKELETWGFPKDSIFEPLDNPPEGVRSREKKRKKKKFSGFRFQRIILRILRRNIHQNAFGRFIRKVRFTCDVLLR